MANKRKAFIIAMDNRWQSSKTKLQCSKTHPHSTGAYILTLFWKLHPRHFFVLRASCVVSVFSPDRYFFAYTPHRFTQNGPQSHRMGHSRTEWAPVAQNGPQSHRMGPPSHRMGLSRTEWAPVAQNGPQSHRMGLSRTEWATVAQNGSTVAQNEPQWQ